MTRNAPVMISSVCRAPWANDHPLQGAVCQLDAAALHAKHLARTFWVAVLLIIGPQERSDSHNLGRVRPDAEEDGGR